MATARRRRGDDLRALLVVTGAALGVLSPRAAAASEDCAARLARLRTLPSLGAPAAVEARRPEVVARAKAAPVLLLREPVTAPPQPGRDEAGTYRRILEASAVPTWDLIRLRRFFANRQELARAMFLREGYLYAPTPALASALVDQIELTDLFREPALWIERGAQRLELVRHKGQYQVASGPEAGQRARLLLFDRVGVAGEVSTPPLHVDVAALAAAVGFEELTLERHTAEGAVARLRVGDVTTEAALELAPPRASLLCEVAPPAQRAELTAARARLARERAVLARHRAVIEAMVAEQLPFDEPRTEEGQQDGNLRPAWRWAYLHGWETYTFNDDTYPVFDHRGRPVVPQVCIDFITDALERVSGTWWGERGQPRARTVGRLDVDTLEELENRRSVEVFTGWAWSRPEWFEVVDLTPEERVPFRQRAEFFRHLHAHRERYRPLDIITIHGLRDDGQLHYHSFFVLDADPVSGMPTLVASNAGKPRIRSWEQEMRPAPLRSIRSRIRPRLEWLEQVVEGEPGDAPASVTTPASAP